MKTLILYLSYDGQTKKIAEKIATQLEKTEQVTLRNLIDVTDSELAIFDRILIGASIRYGKFHPQLSYFIQQNSEILNQKISAFFSVNLTARKAGKNSPETNVYTRKLLAKIAWQPKLVAVFAGALFYPRYSLFDRTMIRFIMWLTGGETNPTKEVEYTNWQQVEEFADQFAKITDCQ
ncbi:protoporphyrinogen oxidase [Mergibacter septicus]|uniref:Protoporphyrinogen IX dehydrogenase [quinone] n=1 Tax=Mergibacter septicus TaxID=221402 RepID=A0A8D4LKL7_9PAST|nr:menaquinone-dependent protoporphyrinogen IX dehydrogenase [Mergibacter septicus]AWX16040.1 protoporphyrinogen oxidase [Mergibacter septicus]QDJ15293.1 protoporphyrinogen oxidase [Mergibacter septicus]UTU48838.1 menaquinone-dependent protoporphyrinogen IX dehydrogenase [Mergibacter septicus]WMR95533.1 menaquinone-dependent protoporphyrinogen IX dehydrogenase [Mergibacter septicus]